MSLLFGTAAAAQSEAPAAPVDHPVIELRQYKIVHGSRDKMIDLFERHFIESQETLGMRLFGTFRDMDDPNRFTWVRGFEHISTRAKSLGDFYFGPLWKAYAGQANPLLYDNDNVLLLRPAAPGSGLQPSDAVRPAPGAPPRPAGMVVATIFYLWKNPDEGFAKFFADRLAPAYAASGLPVLGSYVSESTPNDFPRLPVRQGEKIFVWFTRVANQGAYDKAVQRLASDPQWRSDLQPQLADAEERTPQILRLAPTPRSLMR